MHVHITWQKLSQYSVEDTVEISCCLSTSSKALSVASSVSIATRVSSAVSRARSLHSGSGSTLLSAIFALRHSAYALQADATFFFLCSQLQRPLVVATPHCCQPSGLVYVLYNTGVPQGTVLVVTPLWWEIRLSLLCRITAVQWVLLSSLLSWRKSIICADSKYCKDIIWYVFFFFSPSLTMKCLFMTSVSVHTPRRVHLIRPNIDCWLFILIQYFIL